METWVHKQDIQDIELNWRYMESYKAWLWSYKSDKKNKNSERISGNINDIPYTNIKGYYPASIDYRQGKLLLVSHKIKHFRVDSGKLFYEYLDLNLSKSQYITNKDTEIIIYFLKEFGYPFIPYITNIDCSYERYLILPWTKNDYCQYPYITHGLVFNKPADEFGVAVGTGVLYHLEEFRRYQLFFKDIFENNARKGIPLKEWEVTFLSELLFNAIAGTLVVDEIADTLVPKITPEYRSPFYTILGILIGNIKRRAEMRAEISYCKYCGKQISNKRQKKWGELFPRCNSKSCINKANNDTRNYRIEYESKYKEKIQSQGRRRAKKRYLNNKYKSGKISKLEFNKLLKDINSN